MRDNTCYGKLAQMQSIVLPPRLAALIEGLHEPGVDIPALVARYDSALVG